ncbi:MAG: hypothetical protein OEZ21_02460 [Candidatus Bathyarchaeota archaeon]|nr:hypothetical protein [Candidatus Bathyarchaeota archaeon]MDH5745809.1 hypothetical protein [Candidatus Bathyarchaeota archaeon]
MRKKLVASGIILFTVGFLIAFTPEEIKVYVELSPFSMLGIVIGIVGFVLAISGLLSLLTNRL